MGNLYFYRETLLSLETIINIGFNSTYFGKRFQPGELRGIWITKFSKGN